MLQDGAGNAARSASDEGVVLAIDIGATKLAVGLVSMTGEVLAQARELNPGNVQDALEVLASTARSLFEGRGELRSGLVGVGIACGGPLDIKNGLVLAPPNLPDWDRVEIVRIFADEYGVPTFLDNDATAGAMATLRWDNPAHLKDVVYVTVSSGVGCGVISQGSPYTGYSGNGAELGHIPLLVGGRLCTCGQSGCAEAYVAGIAIGKRFQEQHGDPRARGGVESQKNLAPLSAAEVAAMALAGNQLALAHWENSMLMLRRVLRAALELFNPGLLVVGGGVTEAADSIFSPGLDILADGPLLSYSKAQPPEVRRTSFGRKSGVMSAAAVAWNQLVAVPASESGSNV